MSEATRHRTRRLDGLWSWDPDRDVLSVDARWCELVGHERPADGCFPGATWRSMLGERDARALEQGLEAVGTGSSTVHEAELFLSHPDGRRVRLRHRASRSVGDDGQVRLHGTLQDITVVHPGGSASASDRRFFGRTERLAGVGGWQVDLVAGTVTWSDETCRIHGLSPGHRPTLEEAVGYFTPSARGAIQGCIERAIAERESYDIELPLVRVDGRRIIVRCVGCAEFRDGEAVRLSGAIQDVTDAATRRVAEREASHARLERVATRLSAATESGGIGVWELELGTDELFWDPQMHRLHGTDGDALGVRRWLRLIDAGDRPGALATLRDVVREGGGAELELGLRRVDGARRRLACSARVIVDEAGRALRIVGTARDVTESWRVARELADQHELLRVTLRSIGDGVITTDRAGRVRWMNLVAETMTGWREELARGQPLLEVFRILDGDTREPVADPTLASLLEDRVAGLPEQTVLVARHGEERWIEDSVAPIRGDDGERLGAVLVFHDVTEQRALAREMTWRATHDGLTGLLNRAELESAVGRARALSEREGSSHGLLFVDLDRFKIVNDSCGHAEGDRLLGQVGRLLRRVAGAGDTVARLGGDEFGLVLVERTVEEVQAVAQSLCDAIDAYRFEHDGQLYHIGASVGLVPIDAASGNVSALLRAADTACYAAKEAGRNRVHLWLETDQALHARGVETRWATRLERALDENRFELHAQRIDLLETLPESRDDARAAFPPAGCHAEVLIRLRDERGEPILPGAFLPAAERFGMIARIDRWVLGEAVAWLAEHRARTDIDRLWINLSGQSVGDEAFRQEALALFAEAGETVRRSLCLEITETVAVTEPAEVARFIDALHALGVRVALDDFGAGAASFGYLKSLPVDYLKIDGQFVRDVVDDPLDAVAVRAFADIARVMDIATVAEFVETKPVLEQLREIGIDLVQGWLLHRPAPLDELLCAPEEAEVA